MRARLTIQLEMGIDAADKLRRPVNGSGGFQSLLRALQEQLSETNTLTLTPALIERIARYVDQYGRGGFQGRLDAVLGELTLLAKALEPIAA